MSLVGFGIGISVPSLMAAGMTALPADVKAAGSGVLNTARQLGFVFGVSILIAVFGVTMNGAVAHRPPTRRAPRPPPPRSSATRAARRSTTPSPPSRTSTPPPT